MKWFPVSRRRQCGLSLVELSAAMLISGTLLAVAIPSFSNLRQDMQLTMETNTLLGAIHLTRSESIRRNVRVTLCVSSDGLSCSTRESWDKGWLIFIDGNDDGSFDPEKDILLVNETLPDGIVIQGNTPVASYVSYLPEGMSRMRSGALQMGTITLCRNEQARKIVISASGRPRVQQGSCEA